MMNMVLIYFKKWYHDVGLLKDSIEVDCKVFYDTISQKT